MHGRPATNLLLKSLAVVRSVSSQKHHFRPAIRDKQALACWFRDSRKGSSRISADWASSSSSSSQFSTSTSSSAWNASLQSFRAYMKRHFLSKSARLGSK
uniref:Uncharacterized protein n=1 Tax=Lotharella oceanica TaxID=641309 RepID=A0A7S2TVH2_9EUKA|mmetsp:Transcript_31688/g.59085  ORF Transcript_31688/g.59085 Transcript_31688/m.59085 type:complete len:100 (+) Transcript_31688:127-426(+)